MVSVPNVGSFVGSLIGQIRPPVHDEWSQFIPSWPVRLRAVRHKKYVSVMILMLITSLDCVKTMNPFNNDIHRRQFGRRLWCLCLFLLTKIVICYTTIRSNNNKDWHSSPLKPTISVPNNIVLYKSRHHDSLQQRHQPSLWARSDDIMTDKDNTTSSRKSAVRQQKTIIKGTNHAEKTNAKAKRRTKSTSSNAAVVKGTTTTIAKKKTTSSTKKAESKTKRSSIANKSKTTTVKGTAKKSVTVTSTKAKAKKKKTSKHKSTTKVKTKKKAPTPRKERKRKRIVKHTPHTRELEILNGPINNNNNNNNNNQHKKYTNIIGIDEAGRGPLAGPVVVAAVICPNHLPGIVDGKTISTEKRREVLYEELVSLPKVRYAVCIIDAATIDEINNISEATLQGMRLATSALIVMDNDRYKDDKDDPSSFDMIYNTKVMEEPSIDIEEGCYVVVHAAPPTKKMICRRRLPNKTTDNKYDDDDDEQHTTTCTWDSYYALIDGFMIPKDMPCDSEAIVKGDAKEFCIAAASIIAKVTRDRLMHQYHNKLYPKYNFQQHKGYPTKAHFEAIKKYGPCPIHRRTFAPLKNNREYTTTDEIIIVDDDDDHD